MGDKLRLIRDGCNNTVEEISSYVGGPQEKRVSKRGQDGISENRDGIVKVELEDVLSI